MDWLGIGVLIIGVALLVLVIVLIKPLSKLAAVLDSTKQSTDRLPKLIDDGTDQAHEAFQQVNTTLENVNVQINTIHPLFQIVGDAGEASRQMTSQWLNNATTLKENTAEAKALGERKKYEGLYGVLSFIYYLSQKRDEVKELNEQTKQ